MKRFEILDPRPWDSIFETSTVTEWDHGAGYVRGYEIVRTCVGNRDGSCRNFASPMRTQCVSKWGDIETIYIPQNWCIDTIDELQEFIRTNLLFIIYEISFPSITDD